MTPPPPILSPPRPPVVWAPLWGGVVGVWVEGLGFSWMDGCCPASGLRGIGKTRSFKFKRGGSVLHHAVSATWEGLSPQMFAIRSRLDICVVSRFPAWPSGQAIPQKAYGSA